MTSTHLFGQLNLGQSALKGQQAGMSVSGHNIAHANDKAYHRQRVELDATHPYRSRFGSGVEVEGVRRLTDAFLQRSLLQSDGRQASLELELNALRQLETLFDDAQGLGLRESLSSFWDAWGRLSSRPESELYRADLQRTTQNLGDRFQRVHSELEGQRHQLDQQLSGEIAKVNQLTQQIAELNTRIQQVSSGRGEANDLRDARQQALRQLSTHLEVNTTLDDNQLQVRLKNGWPLVLGRSAHPLTLTPTDDAESGLQRLQALDAKGYAQDLTPPQLGEGRLQRLLHLRDNTVPGLQQNLDRLARGLTEQVNRIHSEGTGLTWQLQTLEGQLTTDVNRNPLSDLNDGTLRLAVLDSQGNPRARYAIPLRAAEDDLESVLSRLEQALEGRALEDPEVREARAALFQPWENMLRQALEAKSLEAKSLEDGALEGESLESEAREPEAGHSPAERSQAERPVALDPSLVQRLRQSLDEQAAALTATADEAALDEDARGYLEGQLVLLEDLLEEALTRGEDANTFRTRLDELRQQNLENAPSEGGLVQLERLGDDRFRLQSRNAEDSVVLEADSSRFALISGLNPFFAEGQGAADLRLDERLVQQPHRIAAGQDALPGDNRIALAVHDLRFQPFLAEGTQTAEEFYQDLVSQLGFALEDGAQRLEQQELVGDQFQRLRDEVASVNLDEEVANMVQYQRGYEAAARFITGVDAMTETVINM